MTNAAALLHWQDLCPVRSVTPSGFPALNAVLPGGGWPNAGLSELLLEPGFTQIAGAWALLREALPAWCHATQAHQPQHQKHVVLIGSPHPQAEPGLPGLPESWAQLSWLWIKPIQQQHAYWAAEQALRCHDTGVVLLWLTQAWGPSCSQDRRTPPITEATALRRLQVLAADAGKPILAFRPQSAQTQASPAPLRLHLRSQHGHKLPLQLLVQVLKRPGAAAASAITLDARNPRLQALAQALAHARPTTADNAAPLKPNEHASSPTVDRLLAA